MSEETSETAAPGAFQKVVGRLADPAFWAANAALVALLVVAVMFSLLSPAFLAVGNIQAILVAGAITIVLAIGQTFAIVTKGIDLSIGATPTLTSVVVGYFFSQQGSIFLALLMALLTGALFGVLNGLVITKGGITDFIVTLGSLSVATGAALVISGGQPVQVIDPVMLTLAGGSVGPVSYLVLLAVVVIVVGHLLMFHTRFGTHLLATGGDQEAARNMGVAVDRIKITAYAISGFLAGIGGIMLTARIGSADPAASTQLLLNAVAAVVLGGVSLYGGRGSIIGPAAGAILLAALLNGLTLVGASEYWQQVAVGTAVIVSAFLTRYQR